jgi:hypothetical protein
MREITCTRRKSPSIRPDYWLLLGEYFSHIMHKAMFCIVTMCQVGGNNYIFCFLGGIFHLQRINFIQPDLGLVHPVAGARGSVVVKALCYKPEGRGFDFR